MTFEDRIRKARISLLKRYPFWGHISMSLTLIHDPNMQTLGVDSQGNLFFGDKLAVDVDNEQLMAIVAHEVFHVADGTFLREGSRLRFLWNLACDAICNRILTENGFCLPHGSIDEVTLSSLGFKISLEDKVSEEVYEELRKQLKQQPEIWDYMLEQFGIGIATSHTQQSGNMWETHKGSDHLTEAERNHLRRRLRRLVSAAFDYAKSQGSDPRGIDRIVKRVLETPPFDWRIVLRQFVTSVIPSDFTYTIPSKKSLAAGAYLPRLKREEIAGFVGIDTSGSISDEELGQFKAQICKLMQSFDNIYLTIYECDAAVHQKYELNKLTLPRFMEMEVKGGGGTVFTPVFEEIAKTSKRSFLIFFTDGFGTFPKQRPPYPVLWVLTANSINPEKIPFGTVTKIWSQNNRR